MELITDNIVMAWIYAAAFLIIMEILLGWTCIIFFVAGSAAMIVGIALSLDLIDIDDYSLQITIFLIFFMLCAAFYWMLFKLIFSKEKNEYSNLAGQAAYVVERPLRSGEVGEVKWSGTVCKAMLQSDVMEFVEVGEKVVIFSVRNNILIVRREI